MTTHLIDFQNAAGMEPIERPLMAKLKTFAAVEKHLLKRLFVKPTGKFSSLEGL